LKQNSIQTEMSAADAILLQGENRKLRSQVLSLKEKLTSVGHCGEADQLLQGLQIKLKDAEREANTVRENSQSVADKINQWRSHIERETNRLSKV
jgi:hypothetical protein